MSRVTLAWGVMICVPVCTLWKRRARWLLMCQLWPLLLAWNVQEVLTCVKGSFLPFGSLKSLETPLC